MKSNHFTKSICLIVACINFFGGPSLADDSPQPTELGSPVGLLELVYSPSGSLLISYKAQDETYGIGMLDSRGVFVNLISGRSLRPAIHRGSSEEFLAWSESLLSESGFAQDNFLWRSAIEEPQKIPGLSINDPGSPTLVGLFTNKKQMLVHKFVGWRKEYYELWSMEDLEPVESSDSSWYYWSSHFQTALSNTFGPDENFFLVAELLPKKQLALFSLSPLRRIHSVNIALHGIGIEVDSQNNTAILFQHDRTAASVVKILLDKENGPTSLALENILENSPQFIISTRQWRAAKHLFLRDEKFATKHRAMPGGEPTKSHSLVKRNVNRYSLFAVSHASRSAAHWDGRQELSTWKISQEGPKITGKYSIRYDGEGISVTSKIGE